MKQQIPVDIPTKPLVTHQKDYYITRDGRRYDFDPPAETLSASRHHPDDPGLGSSTTIISTDQYDTQTTSGLEQLSTSSDEADIDSDSHSSCEEQPYGKDRRNTKYSTSKNSSVEATLKPSSPIRYKI
ncbi:hypothetical protein K3495_g17223 [Podosphaera aphanis]|nr:hypothetical protein K3495_g17223 [Podosphaera aphanis]